MKRLIMAVWKWTDDRIGISDLVGPSLGHLVPRDSKWWYVFGSATMLAFIVQVVTGVALAFSYVSSSSQAYETLQFITYHAPFGRILRGMHYYGASAMVLMVGAHLAQTFLFGAYKFPREMNWATGVLLLGMTLAMGFTGQLLRWDQTAAWSVVVAAEQAGRVPVIGDWLARFILGGNTIGGATLSRFFAIHVFLIPGMLIVFIGLHLWLVLRHGISEPPVPGRHVDPKTYREWYHKFLEKHGHPFFPDGAWRDFVFGTGLIIAIALLALIPPKVEGFVMILVPAVIGTMLLLVPLVNNKGERAASRRPWSIAVVLLSVILIGSLWVVGVASPWSPNFDPGRLPISVIGVDTGPIYQGAQLFDDRGCLNCHLVKGYGGRRGPDLTYIGDQLTQDNMVIRIVNGGVNMPAFGNMLKPGEINDIVAFLSSRKRVAQ
jgi:ubiquinol-cytochrome c reductase cytochrome b subunit